jgi:hypothetical protein
MSNALHEAGRNGFLKSAGANINWVTGLGGSGGVQAALIQASTFAAAIRNVTGTTTGAGAAAVACTNAFAAGDVVVINNVAGTLNANGLWVVGPGVTTSSVPLMDPYTGLQATLLGTFSGSAGYIVDLGPSLGTWASYSANLIGTPVPLATLTEAQGIASAATLTFTSVPVGSGFPVVAIMLVASSTATAGTLNSTDVPIAWIDGTMIVTAAATTATTTLPVEKIPAGIASGTSLAFSDGSTAVTTSGASAAFTRTITTTVAYGGIAGARAVAPATGSGLPVTPNGGNISITWDTVAAPPYTSQHVGIFKL